MNHGSWRSQVMLGALWLAAYLHTARTAAAEVELAGHQFTLPSYFRLSLAAGPPLVERPIVAEFDGRGRLYVAESSGTNDPVEKQLADKPHRIVRLVDTDDDGEFDRSTVFAADLMLPEGLMWLDGSLYVGAPPSIWKLTDTDDDGVADRREEWFQGKTLTGCANDLHGPFLGPDGWIYWCKGGFARQTYERPGKPPLVSSAAHIFRARHDGSGLEPVMTGGMDNPVELIFTAGGERIFSTTFFQHPGGGLRDGLIHSVYGGVYGKIHGVLDGHARTSPDVLPVLTHLGPAAPCGLARNESGVFGPEYRDNLFAALFNLHKITRHELVADGATFSTVDSDFLVAADADFHPTDVLEDADGSLLVVDTGGWYKLCCPSSQLVRPTALGGIYRVRRFEMLPDLDPWGRTIDWASRDEHYLIGKVADRRPRVARRAADELLRRDPNDVFQHLAAQLPQLLQQHEFVWLLTRIDDPRARAAVRGALKLHSAQARHAAILSAGLWRDAQAEPGLLALLAEGSDDDRRASAEALGRIGNRGCVGALLAAAASAGDALVQHSITYALIEIADPQATAAGLTSAAPRVQRIALMALDQMPGGGLRPEQLLPFVDADDLDLAEAALWIGSRHAEWAPALADALRVRLADGELQGTRFGTLVKLLAAYAGDAAIQQLLAQALSDPASSLAQRRLALQAMAAAQLKQVPPGWTEGLAATLTSQDPALVAEAIRTIRALPLEADAARELAARLTRAGNRRELPLALRLDTLAAVASGLPEVDPELFRLLCDQVVPDQPVELRARAAEVLSRARLAKEQLLALARLVETAGPLEIERLLAAFARSNDVEVGLRLIEALERASARAALRVATLEPVLQPFGPAVQDRAKALYARLEPDATQQRTALEALLARIQATPGDAVRGREVFNGRQAACSACHAIGYVGGNVGPDLTRIGQIRSERDLLEAIVFPSASFVRSYEPVQIATDEGRVYSGLLRQETADKVVLAVGAQDVVRVPRARIDLMQPSKVSLMPAGLAEQFPPEQLADLLAFLKACR